MTQLEKHDEKIHKALRSLQLNIDKNNWKTVYQVNAYLNKLLRDRRLYTKLQYERKRNEKIICRNNSN